MRKDFSRGIIVLCVIILLLATPIITNIVAEENADNGNYLGKITFYHNPAIYWRSPLYTTSFEQPQIKDFEFDEINGNVLMSFTLNGSHRKNPVLGWIADRYSVVQVWISDFESKGIPKDYFWGFFSKQCKSFSDEYFQMNLTEEGQFDPLPTNGENKTLTVTVKSGVGIGNMHLGSFFSKHVAQFDINIIPRQ